MFAMYGIDTKSMYSSIGAEFILSSESRHELRANDTIRKLTITDRNFILILKVSVYLQVAKIGTFFSINSFTGKFYIKL